MLLGSQEPKVLCAKIIIDEIILSLDPIVEDLAGLVESLPALPARAQKKKKPEPDAVAKDPGVKHPAPEVGVKDGKLVEIRNVPLDGLVELDGNQMTHQEAIGKKFQRIHILWLP